MTLRVAIVDDEPFARERLRRLIESAGDAEVVAVCRDGDAAVEEIPATRPTLVFLDVQMPGRDGFDVVAALLGQLDTMPLIVFVTAYGAHAVRAFEAQALDYLVKPFDDERFAATMQRARRRLRQERLDAASGPLRKLLDSDAPAEEATAVPDGDRLDRIVLKVRDRTRIVRAEEVDWIEAEHIYARVHLGKHSFHIRFAMHELERRLDPRRFVRIHRSTIVNLDRVQEVQELFRGELELLLHDGTRLKLSRSRKVQLEKLLGQRL